MISGIGYEIVNNSFITLQFQVDIVSEDYNYADGVRVHHQHSCNPQKQYQPEIVRL